MPVGETQGTPSLSAQSISEMKQMQQIRAGMMAPGSESPSSPQSINRTAKALVKRDITSEIAAAKQMQYINQVMGKSGATDIAPYAKLPGTYVYVFKNPQTKGNIVISHDRLAELIDPEKGIKNDGQRRGLMSFFSNPSNLQRLVNLPQGRIYEIDLAKVIVNEDPIAELETAAGVKPVMTAKRQTGSVENPVAIQDGKTVNESSSPVQVSSVKIVIHNEARACAHMLGRVNPPKGQDPEKYKALLNPIMG